jgi:hypothetical protein
MLCGFVALWINATQYLEPVAPEVWDTAIGGSAVLTQWLRNHHGRRLSRDGARDLARVVASLTDTESRRADVEALVEDVLEGEMVAS